MSKSSTVDLLSRAFREPLLAEDEERALVNQLRASGDKRALDRLVTSHLRLVAKIAARHNRGAPSLDDLISEGTVGLLRAARRFDPDRGLRFSSYAKYWIEAQIRAHVRATRSVVKRPRGAYAEALPARAGRAPIAASRALTSHGGIAEGDIRLSSAISGDDCNFVDNLVDSGDSVEILLGGQEEFERRRQLLAQALYRLSERERYVFTARRLWDNPLTLDRLAGTLGVSSERVRQIECAAFKKVEKAVNRMAPTRIMPGLSSFRDRSSLASGPRLLTPQPAAR